MRYEPTEREINTEITRPEYLLRAYKMDDVTKEWTEKEIKRLREEVTKREVAKEQAKIDRKKKIKKAI